MKRESEKHIIFVLGAHRSGTSAITRGLETLGIALGNNLMPPYPDNQKGFFEDLDIHELNISLLKELGHDWHSLAPLSSDAMSGVAASSFQAQALDLLDRKLQGTALLGIKDPRITRLLPFWQGVVSRLQANASYVIACRNPRSVALSLAKRDGFDLEKGYYLWLEHAISSLNHTLMRRRIVVDYDRLMNDPAGQMQRIALAFGLSLEPASSAFKAYEDYLDDGMRHTQFTLAELTADQTVPPPVIDAYRLLEALASDRIAFDSAEFEASLNSLNLKWDSLVHLLAYHRRYDDKVALLEPQLIHARNHIENYERMVRDYDAAIENYRAIVLARDQEIQGYKQAVLERDQAIEGYQERLASSSALLQQVLNSKSWKLARIVQNVRLFLLPRGSRREAWMRSIFRALKLWVSPKA